MKQEAGWACVRAGSERRPVWGRLERYNQAMLQTIRDLLHRDPFQPFRIITSSGDRYDIPNPDLIALGETQIYFAFPRSDRLAWIRLNQIVSVETLQNAA